MPRKTHLRFVVLAASLVALLSACKVETDITLEVKRDGTGVITIVATADKDIIDEVPDLADDLNFTDLDEAWEIDGPAATDDGGLRVTLTREFKTPKEATAILGGLNGDRGPFRNLAIKRSGSDNKSTFALSGTIDVQGGLRAFADDEVLQLIGKPPFEDTLDYANVDIGDAIDVNLIAKLPGKLKSSTGVTEQDGKQSWHVTFDGNATTIEYTSVNDDVAASVAGVARTILIILAIVWVLGAAVLALLVVRAQRRRASRTPTQ